MTEGGLEIVTIVKIQGDLATVRLPDMSEEEWGLTTLPSGIQAGDQVGIEVEAGNWIMILLPRPAGLQV